MEPLGRNRILNRCLSFEPVLRPMRVTGEAASPPPIAHVPLVCKASTGSEACDVQTVLSGLGKLPAFVIPFWLDRLLY